ncbi:UNVERIFIED_CONTAM: hypothetical protein PO554_27220, partial [Klebsiella pneumoniae]
MTESLQANETWEEDGVSMQNVDFTEAAPIFERSFRKCPASRRRNKPFLVGGDEAARFAAGANPDHELLADGLIDA